MKFSKNGKTDDELCDIAEKLTGIKSNYTQFLGFDCANKSLGYTLAFYNVDADRQVNSLIEKVIVPFRDTLGKIFDDYLLAHSLHMKSRTLLQKTKTQKILDENYAKMKAAIISNKDALKILAKYIIDVHFIMSNMFHCVSSGVIDLIPGKKLKESTLMERTVSLKKHLVNVTKNIYGNDLNVIVEEQPTNVNDKSNTVQDQICYEYCQYNVCGINPTWKNRLCFGENLSYEIIRQQYTKKYTANKTHSKLNFLKFIDIVDEGKMLEGVKKENYDDLADSCMEIIAFVKYGTY